MTRIRLNVLGPITASVIGVDAGAPLTQPRLLALLAYLVVARPRGHHSRDTLVALLWPDSDQASGRQGLRNALHRLRATLGDGVIVTGGESFVGVDPAFIECDAIAFEHAVAEERWTDAVARYGGELLQGFHVADAPEFERWLDDERLRLTSVAARAARSAAGARQAVGDLPGAIAAAHRACALEPDNERSFRHYLELLVAAGDRTTAHRAYEDFARRLKREYGVAPSVGTTSALRPVSRESGHEAPEASAKVVAGSAVLPLGITPPRALPTRRAGRRSLVAATLVIASVATIAWIISRARPNAPVAAGAIGADLPARWRADTGLLGRYLRANALLAARRHTASRDSLFRLSRDAPLYAPAWSGLARTTFRSAFEDIPPREALPRAAAAAHRALLLDSTLALAHEALIAQALWGEWDLAGAKKLLDRALSMHPDDSELLNLLATWHRWRGEFDESLEIKRRNAALDPLSIRAVYQIAPSLYFGHRCEEAVTAYRRLPNEVKGIVGDHILYRALVCSGLHGDAALLLGEQALREGDSALAASFTPGMTPAQRLSASERVFQSRLTREFERRRQAWTPPEWIMMNYADRRHADSTLVWLDSMLVERSMMLYVVPFDPLMDFLRLDPRFDAFLRRLPWLPGLPDGPRHLIDSLRLRASVREASHGKLSR